MSEKTVMDFKTFIDEYSPQVESFISSYIDSKVASAPTPLIASFYEDIREYTLRPGKRVRPMLLILSYLGYGGDRSNVSEIVKLASVVEIMHSFLLVHDDIVDKSDKRRGGDALHIISDRKYSPYTFSRTVGSDVAIIVGDLMSFDSIDIIADADIDLAVKNRFLKLFARTYSVTAYGQLLDIINSMRRELDSESDIPFQVSKMKTSYYTICYPLMMGCVLAGKSVVSEEELIERFSLPLGLAFQFRDDLLGVFGSDKTGKSNVADLAEGKFTILIQKTLKNLSDAERREFEKIFQNPEKSDIEISYLKEKIKSSKAFDMVVSRMDELGVESKKYLDEMSLNNDEKSVLLDLTDMILEVNL